MAVDTQCDDGSRVIPQDWVEQFRPRLLAYARNRVASDLAEDLVQDTLLRALTQLEKFRGEGKFESWIFTILRRVMCDHWRNAIRKQNRFSQVKPGLGDGRPLLNKVECLVASNWGCLLELKELSELVDDAIEELPAGQRSVLRLHRDGAGTASQIADRLNISVQNVWVSLHRARRYVASRIGLVTASGVE